MRWDLQAEFPEHLGAHFIACAGATDGNPDLVFTMDTGTDDNGVAIARSWDSDWHTFNTLGDKYLTGFTIVADRNTQSRVAISVAHNYQSKFRYRKTFSLKGRSNSDTDSVVTYKLPYRQVKSYAFGGIMGRSQVVRQRTAPREEKCGLS